MKGSEVAQTMRDILVYEVRFTVSGLAVWTRGTDPRAVHDEGCEGPYSALYFNIYCYVIYLHI